MNRLLTIALLITCNVFTTAAAPVNQARQLASRQTSQVPSTTSHYQPPPPPPPPIDFYTRNLKTLKDIYNLTLYPNNLQIVLDGTPAVPKGLFTNDTKGRVSPLGNFTDYAESIEYFFGLAPTPIESPLGAVFSKADITNFQCGCPEVASSVVQFTVVDRNGTFLTKLKQIGFWRFDEHGAVRAYDLSVITLEDFTSAILGHADFSDPAVQQRQIEQVCTGAMIRCVGVNEQYKSYDDCVTQLKAKPFGTFYQGWSDTVACRSIHVLLTLVRPDVHCPHVGPSGGMKCVDYDYVDREFNDEKLFGTDTLFICPDKLPKPPKPTGCKNNLVSRTV